MRKNTYLFWAPKRTQKPITAFELAIAAKSFFLKKFAQGVVVAKTQAPTTSAFASDKLSAPKTRKKGILRAWYFSIYRSLSEFLYLPL